MPTSKHEKHESMPNPSVSRPRRVAYVEVLGKLWMPMCPAAQRIELRDYDLENIGEFTRDAFEQWLGANACDFSSITDFSVRVGNSTIDWNDEENEMAFNDWKWHSMIVCIRLRD